MLERILSFLQFYWSASTVNSIQAQRVKELLINILEDNRHYYAFRDIELVRKELLKNRDVIKRTDLGVGSQINSNASTTVKQITRSAASFPLKCRWLFKISAFQRSKSVLELGTSVGLSSSYLYFSTRPELITIEGDPAIVKIAKEVHRKLNVKSVILNEEFENGINMILEKKLTFDMIFIDGNHNGEKLLQYVDLLYPILNDNSMIIVDDLYWSTDMTQAWKTLNQQQRFVLSIDLFHIGILIKDKGISGKENYRAIAKKWKPWKGMPKVLNPN